MAEIINAGRHGFLNNTGGNHIGLYINNKSDRTITCTNKWYSAFVDETKTSSNKPNLVVSDIVGGHVINAVPSKIEDKRKLMPDFQKVIDNYNNFPVSNFVKTGLLPFRRNSWSELTYITHNLDAYPVCLNYNPAAKYTLPSHLFTFIDLPVSEISTKRKSYVVHPNNEGCLVINLIGDGSILYNKQNRQLGGIKIHDSGGSNWAVINIYGNIVIDGFLGNFQPFRAASDDQSIMVNVYGTVTYNNSSSNMLVANRGYSFLNIMPGGKIINNSNVNIIGGFGNVVLYGDGKIEGRVVRLF